MGISLYRYIAIIKNMRGPSNNGKTFKYVAPKHRENFANYYSIKMFLPSIKTIIDNQKDSISNLIYLYVPTTNVYKDPVNQYQIKHQETY